MPATYPAITTASFGFAIFGTATFLGLLAPRPAAAQGPTQGPAPAPAATAFVNVAVVPMDTERLLQAQTVVVEGGRITALGPTGTVPLPAGAARVDGRGKVLLPGLADMHAHFKFGIWAVADRADRLIRKEQQLILWLAQGLTTVRLLDHGEFLAGSSEDGLQLRARAAGGALLMPRLYTAGDLTGRLGARAPGPLQLHEVVAAVTSYQAAGYDFIKVHPLSMRLHGQSAAVFDSLAATARGVGLPLVGHLVVPLAEALKTYRSIEHLSGYTESNGSSAWWEPPADTLPSRLEELARATQRAGVWNCPTLYNSERNAVPQPWLARQRRVVRALQDAGAGLLAGSDRLQHARPDSELGGLSPQQRRLEVMYGDAGALHRELQALVAAGLTPYQALATATRNVAAYFGTLDSSGTIAVGQRADLVLLAGNPLADIRQTERIAGVMRGGWWLDRAALEGRTAAIGAWVDRRCAQAAVAAGQAPCPAGIQDP